MGGWELFQEKEAEKEEREKGGGGSNAIFAALFTHVILFRSRG